MKTPHAIQSKPLRTVLTHPVLLAPALLAFSAVTLEHEIRFAPEADSTVSKTFSSEMEFNLDDMSIVVDGQDISSMMGAFEMSMVTESSISVTDTYLAVADGRPTKLKRTFDSLEANASVDIATEMGGETQDIPSSSPLEGATVIYTWNPDEDKYDVAFEEDGGDEDLLEGLVEDFDLRVMLPDGPVSVDDSWTVDPDALIELAMQAQSLKLLPDDMEDMDMDLMEQFMGDDFAEMLGDIYDGAITCTLKGTHEEEGATLADISVVIELTASADLTDMILEVISTIAENEGEEMPPIDFTAADLNADLDGEGTLVWNLSANRVQSMDLNADFSAAFDISASVEDGGESTSFDASFEMSGVLSSNASVE